MKFSPTQISELLKTIDKYLLTFAAHHIGVAGLNDDQISTLTKAGVNVKSIPPSTSNVNQAFRFGMLSDALKDNAAKNMSFTQLKNHISSGRVIKLNALEASALRNLQYQTVNQVVKFGNKIKDDIVDKLVYADKKNNTVQHSKLVTGSAKKAIEERKNVQSVISDIGHSLNDWNRDFGRIADFVMHTAFDEGRILNISKEEGPRALVYKDVYPGACPHCIKNYLTGGIGSAPQIFTIDQLQANGTNVGKKVADWKAVIGPLHPWCRCTIMRVPSGFNLVDYNNEQWIWNGQDFIRDMTKYQRKVERRSKVRVNVNGKITEV